MLKLSIVFFVIFSHNITGASGHGLTFWFKQAFARNLSRAKTDRLYLGNVVQRDFPPGDLLTREL